MRVEFSPEMKEAGKHLRQAAEATAERVVGSDAVHHLRQAARHALKAGLEAIDKAEQRTAERKARPAAGTAG